MAYPVILHDEVGWIGEAEMVEIAHAIARPIDPRLALAGPRPRRGRVLIVRLVQCLDRARR